MTSLLDLLNCSRASPLKNNKSVMYYVNLHCIYSCTSTSGVFVAVAGSKNTASAS